MSKKIMLLVVVSVLWSCDQQKEEVVPVKKQEQAQVDAKPVVAKPAPKVSVEETATVKKTEEQPKKKLNLSIPEISLAEGTQSPGVQKPGVLPNMFEKRQASTSVGGEILRNEENENYLESIDGASVNIEIKTD